jgi:hypothetical protein
LFALVPFLANAFVFILVLVFTKLNLYHIEAQGALVNDLVREAYYSQIFAKIIEQAPNVGFLGLSVFILGYITMNWATSPFTRARSYIEFKVLRKKGKRRNLNFNISEDPVFEQLIAEYCEQILTGVPIQANLTEVKRPWAFRFLAKISITFSAVSFLSGLSLGSIIFIIQERIVGLSLQLVQGRKISAHFFNAQQEILEDSVKFTIFLVFIVNFFIGRAVYRFLRMNLFAFSKAIAEDRFPIAIRANEIYYPLAETLNRAYAKHKKNRA